MALIIAIESDYKRRRLLATLIREFVKADVKVVDAVAPALELMRARTPDLVLTPTLLAPRDSADLIAFVKEIDAPYVQLVTLPALDMLGDVTADVPAARRWLPVLLRRRPAPNSPQYDRAMVGAQIADALERAREAREEYRAARVRRAAREEEMALVRLETPSVIRAIEEGDLKHADRHDLMRVANALERHGRDDRRRAHRRPLADIPWLSGIKLEWAGDAALVNISASGALVETGSKLLPGTTTELQLNSQGGALVVPARVIRSEIARVDGFGVRYHAAAAFDREIDLSAPQQAATTAPPEALAQLLTTALAERAPGEPAHVRFARGLRELVGARDVQIKTMYSAPASGPETLYFDVPGSDRARTTLQVVFPRNHYVTSSEFQLLKAAAWLTAAALEFEQTSVTARAAVPRTSSTAAAKPAAMIAEAVA